MGVPIHSTEVISIDEKGSRNQLGVVGELAAKGPQIMKGYWNNKEETANVFTKDGYLRTGDSGYTSEDGVYVVGRIKDQINSGGYKIWPHEVESVLLENEHVKEVAVVGIPDPTFGEVVKAFVVLKSPVKEEELKAFSRARLSGYKVPRYFEFTESLPKSSVGKVLHRELRLQTDTFNKNNA